ncbi:MAG TPA: crossover junction endodeoxyribonuclease RuvC [Planctomycetota bacterium]|nr:crossover junction endodeoxyribonuclease RuvC [Planctomycetota bacterium]
MLILGIDPGTRIIGYGLIQTQPKTKVITYGVIKTASGVRRQASNALDAQYTTRNAQRKTQSASELSTRLLRSYQQILKIIKEYQPDQMAIETVFFSMDAQATIKIGEARGVALLAAATTSTPVYEYSPAEVKKSVTGNGRADKIQVAEMVKNILSLDEIPKPYDASDALAIAICHSHRMM